MSLEGGGREGEGRGREGGREGERGWERGGRGGMTVIHNISDGTTIFI